MGNEGSKIKNELKGAVKETMEVFSSPPKWQIPLEKVDFT